MYSNVIIGIKYLITCVYEKAHKLKKKVILTVHLFGYLIINVLIWHTYNVLEFTHFEF